MKMQIIFLPIFLILLLEGSVQSIKWTLKTTDLDNSSTIETQPGQYKQIKIVLEKVDASDFVEKPIKLSLEPKDSFKLLKDVAISPLGQMEYIAYIGTECSTKLTGDITLTWNADQQTSADKEIQIDIKSFTMKIVTKKAPITLQLIDSAIPMNSYGFFTFAEIYNMKDIEINLKGKKGESDQKILISKFELDKKRMIEDLKYTSGQVTEQTDMIYTLSLLKEQECFELTNSDISYTIKNINPVNVDGETKMIIIDNYRKKTPTENNSILISTKIPVAPVLLSCMTTTTGKEFKDDEIRGQQKDANQKQFYFQAYIKDPQDSYDILFTKLERKGEYRLKCVLDNTANEKSLKESTGVIIGKFKKSDIMDSFDPNAKKGIKPQCAVWTFETKVIKQENDPFLLQANYYCNNFFYGSEEKKEGANGCVTCEPIWISSNTINICISSTPICETEFKGNVDNTFSLWFETIKTKEKIAEMFELNDYDVKTTVILKDEISPDKTKIVGELDQQSLDEIINFEKKEIKFSVTSTNENDIECYFNSIDKESFKWKFSDEIKERKEILKKGVKTDIVLDFKSDAVQKNQPYNIVFNCFNLPQFAGHLYDTAPFVLLNFVLIQTKGKEDDKTEPKKNCQETPLSPQCIKKTTKMVKDLVSGNPKDYPDITDEVEIFSQLNSLQQKVKLEIEKEILDDILKNEKDKAKRLNQLIKLSELLNQRDCLKSPGYETCRQSKKEIEKAFMSELKTNFLNCEEFIKFDSIGYKDEEDNVKMALIMLTTLTNNADSLNDKDSDLLSDVSKCLLDSFSPIWDKLVKKNPKDKRLKIIKKDLVHMLLRITSNFIDILKYDELDKYVTNNIEKTTRLILNDKNKNIRGAIEKAVALLAELGTGSFENESITVKTYSDDSITPTLLRMIEDETHTESNFSSQGIKVKFLQKYLLAKYKANKISLAVYENYPLLSVDNDSIFPKGISIKLFGKYGQEVKAEDIDKKPEIFFMHNKMNTKSKPFEHCYYYDETTKTFNNKGILSNKNIKDTEQYTICQVGHFTDFVVGNDISTGLAWWAILLIVLGCLIGVGLIVFSVILCKKKNISEQSLDNEKLVP